MTPHRIESAEGLAQVWPTVAPWLEAALASSNNPETLLDVYEQVSRRPGHDLWVCDTATILTVLVAGQKGPLLHLWLAGGAMDGIQQLYPLVEAFARELGCISMTLIGRRGWERSFLRDEGWAPTLVHLEKRF